MSRFVWNAVKAAKGTCHELWVWPQDKGGAMLNPATVYLDGYGKWSSTYNYGGKVGHRPLGTRDLETAKRIAEAEYLLEAGG